jgi:hypothetical protein
MRGVRFAAATLASRMSGHPPPHDWATAHGLIAPQLRL